MSITSSQLSERLNSFKTSAGAWVVLLFLCALGLMTFMADANLPKPQALGEVVQVNARVATTPAQIDERDARSVRLPYQWHDATPAWWFGVKLGAVDTQTPLAVFIPRIANRAELWVNNQLVEVWGERGQRDYDQVRHPVWRQIPAQFLQAKDNRLWLRVEGALGQQAGLSPIYFGDTKQMKRLYNWQWLLEIGSFYLLFAASLALGGLGLIYGARTQNFSFLVFSMAALALCLRGIPVLVSAGGQSYDWFYILSGISYGAYVALIQVFTFMQMQIKPLFLTKAAWALLGATFVAVPAHFFLPSTLFWVEKVWLAWLMVSTFACTPFILYKAWREPSGINGLFVVAVLLSNCLGAYDFVIFTVQEQGFGLVSLTRFGAVFFLLVMAVVLLEQHLSALRTARELNADLNDRVAKREAELRELYAREATNAEQRTLRQERERITQDMHDGLGMHLNALQLMLKSPARDDSQMQESLQDAIDQLRLTVDSISPVSKDVTAILAQLRYRLGDRLAAAGITLQWEVERFPDSETFGAEQAVQLQYFLFEVFANILKHAKASLLRVRAHYDQTQIRPHWIEISDNGIGFDVAKSHAGRGLHHLSSRATKLGAQLSIDSNVSSAQRGTTIVLTW